MNGFRGVTVNRIASVWVGLSLLATPARAEEPARLVVLVLPLVPKRVERAFAETIDDLVASELAQREQLKVTTLTDVNDLIQDEMRKDLLGCEDVACSAEIGGALGADRILAGSVGHFGESYILTLRWLDAVYNDALGRVSKEIADEAGAPAATRAALRELLNESRAADETSARRKSRPTFWTLELSAGANVATAPEPYDIAGNASVRLAWGGRPRNVPVYFYAVGGLGYDFLLGDKPGQTGDISYGRHQLTPFLEGRAALPIGFRNRLRLVAGAGAGLSVELYSADQTGGIESSGTHVFPELRLVAGIWHRFVHHHAVFAGYRWRMQLRGDGADSVSEAIQIGSSASTFWIHAVEIGWAFHF